jgi:ATP-binding cassette subfamily B protein
MRRDAFYASSTWFITVCSLVAATAAVVVSHADIATVFLVVTYTSIIAQELWEFSQSTLRNINRALGEAKEMTDILAIQPSVADPAQPEKPVAGHGAIEFRDMTFTHGDSKLDLRKTPPPPSETSTNLEAVPLFHGLNLTIAAGDKIGLVGHSGSGKTTLTKLLLRFYDIDGGQILIDDQDISRIAQNNLRQQIAYVPQEPLLFHRSLRENIAYGKPDASQEDIEEAARKAHAHEFIIKLPQGYDTTVGERGVKLSGGQRQRIAIARAILKDAPILLLDEATSALDSESEQLIQSALWELMRDCTAIVIAHRLSTIQRMDRIIVLDDGSIAEQGSHKELLAHPGIYANLWAHQSGGFLED